MPSSSEKANRKLYLDILRIIACFLVIYNHLPGYSAYQSASGVVQTFGYMFLTMITRLNVPVFLMMSGSLLLSKDIGYKKLCGRVLRIIGAISFVNIAMYVILNRNNIAGWSIVGLLRLMLDGSINGTYWYLYAYLGFLIVLPFMRSIAKHLKHKDILAMLIGHFLLWTVWTFGNYIAICLGSEKFTLHRDFVVPFMSIAAFFYPLLGHYFDNVLDIHKFKKKHITILCGACLGGIIISSCFTYHQGITTGYTQGFVQTFDYVTAICAFVVVKYVVIKTNNFGNNVFFCKAITFISSLTFGIYLMEPILKLCYNKVTTFVSISHPQLLSAFWCVFAMVVCGVMTYVLKKIPIIQKIF